MKRLALVSIVLSALVVACTEPGPVGGRVVSLEQDGEGDMRITLALTNEGDVATGISCSVDLPEPGRDFTLGVTSVGPGETHESTARLEELEPGDIDPDDITIKCEPDDLQGPVTRF